MRFGADAYLTSGTTDASVMLWITRGLKKAPEGEILIIRGTSSDTPNTGVWDDITFTWDTELPPGQYAVIGAEYVYENSGTSGEGLAFRLVMDGQDFRPGALLQGLDGDKTASQFLGGGLGEWGRFRPPAMPRVQMFSNTTIGTNHTVWLQVVKVG